MKKINWFFVSMVVLAIIMTVNVAVRGDLNPQPEPPGIVQDLNPQPEPPGIFQALNPQPEPPGVIGVEPQSFTCPVFPTTNSANSAGFTAITDEDAVEPVHLRLPGGIICLHD